MKHGNKNYMEVTKLIIEEGSDLSGNTVKVYIALKYLEQKFTSNTKFTFTYTDKELCELTKLSLNTVKKAKKELVDSGFIETSIGDWLYPPKNANPFQKPTQYKILK